MKRLLAVCLCIVCMFACFSPLQSVSADEMPLLALEQVNVTAGESVQVRLRAENNPGIVAMIAVIQYDTSALQLTGVQNGEIFPDATVTFGNDLTIVPYKLTWLDALSKDNYASDGTLALLTFRALPNAPAGKTTISLSYEEGSTFNCDLQRVRFAVQSGSINITRPTVAVTDVTLPETLTVGTGKTTHLTATVLPGNATNPAVTWESGSPAVASVDADGNVTGLSGGTSVITVTTVDGGKTATCTVTVTVSVTAVSLPQTLALTTGQTSRLTAAVQPSDAANRAVTWRSSAPTIASVDADGNVTAHAAGRAVITVTTADGGKTASCTVTVTAATVPVTGVTLPASLTVNYKSDAKLTAVVQPTNATNPTVTWTSDNTGVVEVDANGNLTTHRKGTATITATTADGGKTASCRVTVQYTFLQKIIIYLLFGFIWYVK